MAEIESNRDFKLCAKCHAPSLLFCSKCRITPYCSMDCQKGSWKRHRTVCKLNAVTPSTKSVSKIEDVPDFDVDYSYVLIRCPEREATKTLSNTLARLNGFNSLLDRSVKESLEGNILLGFSHEDSFVYRYHLCSDELMKSIQNSNDGNNSGTNSFGIDNSNNDYSDASKNNYNNNSNCNGENNNDSTNNSNDKIKNDGDSKINCNNNDSCNNKEMIQNNLATQLLMVPNCVGNYIIYKTRTISNLEDDSPKSNMFNATNNSSSFPSSLEEEIKEQPSVPDVILNKNETFSLIKEENLKNLNELNKIKNKHFKLKLTKREVWGMIEYRHLCNIDGVVSDRIHRINMQRKEGLKALKETIFTEI